MALIKESLKNEISQRKLLEAKIKLDNSKQIKNEDSHLKNEDIFRSMIQNSTDIVTLIDKNGIICYSSSSIKDILGYSENELLNRNFKNYYPYFN